MLRLGILIWVGLEFAIWLAAIRFWGLGPVFLVGLGTLLAGLVAIRLGAGLQVQAVADDLLRQDFQISGFLGSGLMLAAGVLLILPGLLSDGLGVLLLAVAIALRIIPGRARSASSQVASKDSNKTMDLRPDEWSSQ